jgi:hypothetical protein
VASNVPRLDYLGSSCPRLLLEPQRTNYQLYSENSAQWIQPADGIAVAYNTTETLDPSGYYGAEKVTAVSGNRRMFDAVTNPSGAFTMSAFVKAGTGNIIRLLTTSASVIVDFNLTTQTITSSVGTGTITNYGNGWYRVTATGTSAITLEVAQYVFPNSAGQFVYFWGAQFEAGAYATSYIPTTTAAVTRLADAASKTGVSSLIGQTEGVWYYEGIINDTGTEFQILNSTTNTSNAISITRWTLNRVRARIWSNSVLSVSMASGNNVFVNTKSKIALSYESGNVKLFYNGALVASSTNSFSFTVPISELQISVMVNFFGSSLNTNNVDQVLIFPTKLTDAQCIELTTL